MCINGQDGTDSAIADKVVLEAGVAVVAASLRKVIGTRDSAMDIGFYPPPDMNCGNRLVLDPVDGWQIKYCHMQPPARKLHPGDKVERGKPPGLIGQSRLAEFPHWKAD